MTDRAEVVIVGGGAAGCAVAYFLARAGARATLVEREGVAGQASGFSMGGLNPLQGAAIPGPLGPLAIESYRMHLGLWDELAAASGVDFHGRIVSHVTVAFEESELPGMRETQGIFEAADGFSARWLEPEELYVLEPRIARGAVGALYTHGNAALDSYLYTVALHQAAGRLGAAHRDGTVTGLRSARGRAASVLLADGEVPCDVVVLAMGPWSRDAEGWLGCSIPVEPLKGEILRMDMGGPPLAHDFAAGDAAVLPKPDGLVWCGSTEERLGFDRRPSDSARRSILQGAARLIPAVKGARLVMHTACLRPVTPDSLPIIGRVPGWDNVWLATGPGKKGILLSPAMGKAVADMITQGATALPVEAMGPERFS